MAVYGQPKMLNCWFEAIRGYHPDVLKDLELIIVDDHGDPSADVPRDIRDQLPCQLFRVLDNIAWNQPGARNLALDHCRTDLILFVDPDMVFEAAMMRNMLEVGLTLNRRQVVRFMLRHVSDGRLDSSSPNTWFMFADDFRHLGGYDEDFCGNKGWSDVQLLDIVSKAYKIIRPPELFADFYGVEQFSDAMVDSLPRSTKANKAKRLAKQAEARKVGGWLKWIKQPRKRIRFRWERVL
ncbi:MAG TPA: glycosyltransferase family A protein [Thermoleophilia bacterium]|nr:glycosyltransferase family A protein [Thermoleophilia bacterium]